MEWSQSSVCFFCRSLVWQNKNPFYLFLSCFSFSFSFVHFHGCYFSLIRAFRLPVCKEIHQMHDILCSHIQGSFMASVLCDWFVNAVPKPMVEKHIIFFSSLINGPSKCAEVLRRGGISRCTTHIIQLRTDARVAKRGDIIPDPIGNVQRYLFLTSEKGKSYKENNNKNTV